MSTKRNVKNLKISIYDEENCETIVCCDSIQKLFQKVIGLEIECEKLRAIHRKTELQENELMMKDFIEEILLTACVANQNSIENLTSLIESK